MQVVKLEVWLYLWATWDLRLAILFSLFLQIFLTFSAPQRKRMSNVCVLVPMWLAYLLADATAVFAFAHIVRGQEDTSGPLANPDLVAFWAPFLLLHLGGPDSITAFSLEDNELWLRHLLGLGFPCWAVVYVIFRPFPKTELWPSTLLIFILGLIKYIERTRSLYLASSPNSVLRKPDPGPGYAKLMDEYTRNPKIIEMLPKSTGREEGPNIYDVNQLSGLKVVQLAHNFLTAYLLPMVADLMLSSDNHSQRKDFFLKRTAQDAFKVVEVELNFLYDMLYTKAGVVFGMFGFLVRIILIIVIFSSLALFYFMEKRKFKTIDIGITYTLLLGTAALESISLLMALNSNWIAVGLKESYHPNCSNRILRKILNIEKVRSSILMPREKPRCFSLANIVHRRWSECLSQFNLLDYCLHPRQKWWGRTVAVFGLTKTLDAKKYVETVEFTDRLRDFIFEELKMKSKMATDLETANKIYSARGDWTLRSENYPKFLRWTSEVEFDKSLLLWHIATELCFNTDDNDGTDDIKILRDISKLLSDYMLYLLIVESSMITTPIGIGETRFKDTCAEANDFFHGKKIARAEEQNDKVKRLTCKNILDVDTQVDPDSVMGDNSKSVLFSASILAKELKDLPREIMWSLIGKVWVELLSFAACRCRPRTHAAQLGKGGQFMTLVWLLMANMGLANQFLLSEGDARAEVELDMEESEGHARAEVEPDMEESEGHARSEVEPDMEESEGHARSEVEPDMEESEVHGRAEVEPDMEESEVHGRAEVELDIDMDMEQSEGHAKSEVELDMEESEVYARVEVELDIEG